MLFLVLLPALVLLDLLRELVLLTDPIENQLLVQSSQTTGTQQGEEEGVTVFFRP